MCAPGGDGLWALAHQRALLERMRAARAAGDGRRCFDIALALILPHLKKALHG